MTPEKLHQLVSNLSKGQRKAFRRSLLGKNTMYEILYDRLCKYDVTAEVDWKKVRGKEFRDPSKYYRYRVHLAEKIIGSLIAQEGHPVDEFAFIRKAYLEELPEMGKKHAEAILEAAWKEEDFEKVLYIYRFFAKLELELGVKINAPERMRTEAEAAQLVREIREIEGLWKRAKYGVSQNFESRKLIKFRLKSELPGLTISSILAQHLLLRLKVAIEVLDESYASATTYQAELVHLLIEKEQAQPLVLEEVVQLIRLSITSNDLKRSQRYFQLLEEIEPQSARASIIKEKKKIAVGVIFADHFANSNLAFNLRKSFTGNIALFSETEQSSYWFFLGTTHFYSEQYDEAYFCFLKAKQIPSNRWYKFSWEIDALCCLCLLAMDRPEEAFSAFRAAKRRSRDAEAAYPGKAVKIIGHYVHQGEIPRPLELIRELEELYSDPNEKRASLLFNLNLWLYSQYTRKPAAYFLKQYGKDNALREVS